MSVGSTIRSVAFATAAAATLLVASSSGVAAQQTAAPRPDTAALTTPLPSQQPFTRDECAGIAVTVVQVVRVASERKAGVSNDFRQSMRNWLGPNVTCDGPRDIVIKTGEDADAFNTIRATLGAASRPIDLVARGGLRAIGPTAALGPSQ